MNEINYPDRSEHYTRKMTSVMMICSICNTLHSLKMNQTQKFMVEQYIKNGRGIIPTDEALPFLTRGEREFVITGHCAKCQELLYNDSSLAESPRYDK